MERFQIERVGPAARVALANPPANTLDIPLMTGLAAALKKLTRAAEPPRVIVLASSVDGQFSQGIDPRSVLSTDVYGRKQIFLALAELVEALWFAYIPVVADINGPALAGGAVLAALADFAVISRDSGKICFSEPKVGLPLPRFVQRLVQRKVNPASWNDVMLLGRNIDAAEACRIGFAHAVYATPDERDEALNGLVGRIARLPPLALTETLRQARRSEVELLSEFRADLSAFADFLTDDYLGKGLRAVLKGESPKF